MEKLKRFKTATQDSKGFWWAEDSEGNRYAVDPFSEVDSESGDEFTGYREVDRQNEANVGQQGAGLPMDSWRWKSGQILTPQDMQQISQIMSLPGRLVGVDGPMSVEQYLADPRSTVKVENGQYVYRPEQAKGDWESIDRESFLESLGAIPFIAGSFALPYLSSLGVIGPGASVMGQTGNMNFLGDMTNLTGAAEGAAGAAGSSAINEVGSFTGDPTQGWNVYDTLANPTGIESGTITGTLDGGTFNNALEMGGDTWSNAIDEVGSFTGDSSAGWNVSDTVGGTGGGTVADNINWNTIDETGSFTGDSSQGWNVSGTSQGGILSEIARKLGLPGVEEMMKKSQTNPFLSTLIRGLTLYQQGKTGDEALDLMRQGIERSDPFGSQRQFYQDRLKQSYTDPNFFKNDPTLSGIRNMAMNDVSRTAAARGYNNSSNLLYNIGQRLSDEGTKYALGYQNQLGQLAGGGISPAGVAQASAQGANLVTQQGNQQSGNWGNFISSLPNAINQVDKLTTPSSMP